MLKTMQQIKIGKCSFGCVGVARGCGWQKIGACINLGAFYVVGVPAAYLAAFVLRAGGLVRAAAAASITSQIFISDLVSFDHVTNCCCGDRPKLILEHT
jgi:Na+-driven multidrug efflux pump